MKKEGSSDPFKHSREKGDIQLVTLRSFEDVARLLRLDLKDIKPDQKTLSIGDGLSEFPDILAAKTKSAVVSLDPIYADVNPYLGTDEARQQLAAAKKRKPFLEHVEIETWWGIHHAKKIKNGAVRVAGSVYELPFEEETFDHILLNQVFQYVDLSKALPEMVRVLKKANGEIRFGEPLMWVKIMHDKPVLVLLAKEKKRQHVEKFLQGIQTVENQNIFGYAAITKDALEARSGGNVSALIFQAGGTKPKAYEKLSDGTEPKFKTFKINPEEFVYSNKNELLLVQLED